MTALGLALTALGWFFVLRGIARKRTSVGGWHASVEWFRALARRTVSAYRRRKRQLLDWWQRTRQQIHNWKEAVLVKLKVKKGRALQELALDLVSATVKVSGNLTVRRGAPTPEGNQDRIDRLEQEMQEWKEAADTETLYSDAYTLIGGVITILGTFILALS